MEKPAAEIVGMEWEINDWTRGEEGYTHLSAWLVINGIDFSLEAFEVELTPEDIDNPVRAVGPYQEELEAMEFWPETFEYKGRHYVMFGQQFMRTA